MLHEEPTAVHAEPGLTVYAKLPLFSEAEQPQWGPLGAGYFYFHVPDGERHSLLLVDPKLCSNLDQITAAPSGGISSNWRTGPICGQSCHAAHVFGLNDT